MNYRIEKIDVELNLVGRGKAVKTSRAFKTIPTLWSGAKKDGFMEELIDLSWGPEEQPLGTLLGICGQEAASTLWGYGMMGSRQVVWKP